MSKVNAKAMALFTKEAQPKVEDFHEAFEMRQPQAMGHFGAIFGQIKLSAQEENTLKELVHAYNPDSLPEAQIDRDFHTLVEITTQIRAIERQSILLHGERIAKAQSILAPYRDGAFTSWMTATYGNRQTPYSLLQYYEFHKSLTKELQMLMQKMPRKAAYILASREGDPRLKAEIIRQHYESNQNELITLIQERFPLPSSDQRRGRDVSTALIESIENQLTKLIHRKNELSSDQKKELATLRSLLEEILT